VAPDGTLIDPYHVVELRNWVTVVAITADQDIVLVREYRHGTGAVMLELPAGMIEAGEVPLAAAERELREETGFGSETWRQIGVFPANPARFNNHVLGYLAVGATRRAPPAPEAGECLEVVTMPLRTLLAGIGEGTISLQAAHLAALLCYLLPAIGTPDELIAAATASWQKRPD
jgi:8-oxo-dGTP pyrophosphatase MutT (NUDIX family)